MHELPEALLHDRRRQNEFLAGRVASIIRFAWPDTTTESYIPTVLRKALSSATGRSGGLLRESRDGEEAG